MKTRKQEIETVKQNSTILCFNEYGHHDIQLLYSLKDHKIVV